MIKQALDEYAKSLKKTWAHDRTKTVGSSEIALCERKIWFAKNEHDEDDDYLGSYGATMRGDIMEEHVWFAALKKKFGKQLLFAGKDQKTLQDGLLSSTPDGILTGLKRDALKHLGIADIESDCILVEAKSIDPRTNMTQEKTHHAAQTQIQLGLVRKLTKYKPMYALISYIDASFYDQVTEFPVRFNPKSFAAGQLQAKRILTAKTARDLKPVGFIAGGRDCEHCPFVKPCGIVRRDLPYKEKPVDPQFRAEVSDTCREILAQKKIVDAENSKLIAMNQDLKDRLREKSVRVIKDVVTWSAVKGRVSVDNKALQAAAAAKGINIGDFETVGDPTDRLQITLKD